MQQVCRELKQLTLKNDTQSRNQYDAIWQRLGEIDRMALEEARTTRAHISDRFERLHVDQASAFHYAEQYTESEHQRTRDHFDQAFHGHPQSNEKSRLQDLHKSLHFPAIHARRDAISPKHERTFEWIFKLSRKRASEDHRFVQWLQEHGGVYWISGKAGSGKSTLMQYITNSPKLRNALKLWSGSDELLVGSFFFWKSGTSLQNSLEGLLRSLLFQGLQQSPALLSEVLSPELDSAVDPKYHVWMLNPLKTCLRRFVSRHQTRFALFVDGLDEFTGDHLDILDFFDNVASLPNTKICISSRPWAMFQTRFDTCPKIRLEDLTAHDIAAYVRNKLGLGSISAENTRQWLSRSSEDQEKVMEKVAKKIVKKAEGVFIWVATVVKSIKRGELELDSQQQLLARIEYLDSDIEALYAQMLNEVEPRRRKQQARIVKMARYFLADDRNAQSQFDLRYALYSDRTVEQAISAQPLNPTKHDWVEMKRTARNQLEASTGGLFHVEKTYESDRVARIEVSHQTVAEFLKGNQCSEGMMQYAEQEEEVELVPILIANVLFLKELGLYVCCSPPLSRGASWLEQDTRNAAKTINLQVPVGGVAFALFFEYVVVRSWLMAILMHDIGGCRRQYFSTETYLMSTFSAWHLDNYQESAPTLLEPRYDLLHGDNEQKDGRLHASYCYGMPNGMPVDYTKMRSDQDWSSLLWSLVVSPPTGQCKRRKSTQEALLSRAHSILDTGVDTSLEFIVFLLGKQLSLRFSTPQMAYLLSRRHPGSGVRERMEDQLPNSRPIAPEPISEPLISRCCYFGVLSAELDRGGLKEDERYQRVVREGEMGPGEREARMILLNRTRELLLPPLRATPTQISHDTFVVSLCRADGTLFDDADTEATRNVLIVDGNAWNNAHAQARSEIFLDALPGEIDGPPSRKSRRSRSRRSRRRQGTVFGDVSLSHGREASRDGGYDSSDAQAGTSSDERSSEDSDHHRRGRRARRDRVFSCRAASSEVLPSSCRSRSEYRNVQAGSTSDVRKASDEWEASDAYQISDEWEDVWTSEDSDHYYTRRRARRDSSSYSSRSRTPSIRRPYRRSRSRSRARQKASGVRRASFGLRRLSQSVPHVYRIN